MSDLADLLPSRRKAELLWQAEEEWTSPLDSSQPRADKTGRLHCPLESVTMKLEKRGLTHCIDRMTQFLGREWFLTCLAGVLLLGFCWPSVFEPFANATWLSNLIVASVLFVMALPLETRSVGNSLRRPWIPLLASAVNMGLLPLVAWGAS